MFNHIKVLLRKDILTLKRNWIYLIMFFMLPLTMMYGFWTLETYIDRVRTPEKHNTEKIRYTRKDMIWTSFLGSGIDYMYENLGYIPTGWTNQSTLAYCSIAGRHDIGLVAPPTLQKTFKHLIQEQISIHVLEGLKLWMFDSQDDLFENIRTNMSREYCFGVEIGDLYPGIDEVNVTMLIPRELAQDTYKPLVDQLQFTPDWWNWNFTTQFGMPHLMVHLTDIIVLFLRGRPTNDVQLLLVPMKTPEFTELPPFAAQQLSLAFPFFYICIYLLPLYYMVTKLAEERESRAREGMKMMGLKDRSYFIGWFIFLLLINLVIATLIVAVLRIEVFKNSNQWLIWSMSLMYGMSLYGFSFMLVAFLPNKKASATAATVVHLLSYYFALQFKGHKYGYLAKALIACCVPNCGMSMMLDHLLHCEIVGGVGLSLRNAALPFEHFDFISGLYCQAVCIFVWAFIGCYLDQVVPKQLGISKPWYFLCQFKKKRVVHDITEQEKFRADLTATNNFEKQSDALKATPQLKIRGLTMIYPDGKKAVDNVSMTMYEGQIFALLGHNGAGKTTTIGMLTGLLQPTAGTGSVLGFDIFEDQELLRENMGVCPQHNVLFEYLTVREHLELYATFKGVPQDQIKKRVDTMIFELELDLIQNQLASTLSGGQKRKTSAGIALIGDSKLIMLDEPTSGMDTTTRAKFWQMLKFHKKNKIIILTTHYMDEADNMGDRICIMAEGEVQTSGSNLFLKNRFGVGYNLILSKQPQTNSSQVEKFIKKQVPEAVMMQEVSTEIHYQFPERAAQKFKDFFKALDSNLTQLHIGSYGVTVTTLEQIFLKIGHGIGHETTSEKIQKASKSAEKFTERQKMLADYSIADHQAQQFSWFNQLKALIKKKVLVQIRDTRSCIMDIILPCLMIFIGVWASTLDLLPKEFPARHLSLYNFPQGQPFIHNDVNFNQTLEDMDEYIEYGFRADIGPGKLWSEEIVVPVNKSARMFDNVKTVDNYIFDTRHEKGPYWGEFYFQQAYKDSKFYAIGAYVNASQPAAALTMTAYALQSVVRSETENPNFKLNFFERPCPFNLRWEAALTTVLGVFASLSFAIAFMMVSDTIVQSLINERKNQTKHQIMLSGADRKIYWLSHYIIDVITHMIPSIVTIVSCNYFGQKVPQIEYLFMLFCLVNPLFLYFVSFFFDTDAKASIFIRILYFALGGIAPIAIQILNIINRQTIEWALYFKPYFFYFPIYNLAIGFIGIQNRKLIEKVHHRIDELTNYDWLIAGESVFRLIVEGIFFYCAIMFLEYRIYDKYLRKLDSICRMAFGKIYASCSRKKSRVLYRMKTDFEFVDTEEAVQLIKDEDPVTEQKRVKSVANCAVKVQDLNKSYTYGDMAVDNLSFALEYGECFALLGVTGAGKTSTFKCLTGEEWADSGKLSIGNYNVLDNEEAENARKLIGYCPQFEAIFEGITVREHLEIYAHIKGIKREYIQELIQMSLEELDLLSYADVRAQNLSGGNKRKLQCSLALLGNPPIMLLDEPSTGVDPQAKRFMWTLISNISVKRKKSCVILTTHSMEEAEALATKMGIMVKGQFQCFGTATHIKHKYAQGFQISVNYKQLSDVEVAQRAQSLGYKVDQLLDRQAITQLMRKLNSLLDIHLEKQSGTFLSIMQTVHQMNMSQALHAKLQEIFGNVSIVESLANTVHYKVPKNGHSIGFVFGLMDEFKEKYSLSEYTASQTTLDQIFNMFANQAKYMGKNGKKTKQD